MMTAMALDIRPYDRDRDLDAVVRTWLEVGWLDGDSESDTTPLDGFLAASNVEVGMLDEVAECAVAWVPGSIRYDVEDLSLSIITAVTTSRIARKHGFATVMTARALRASAEEGAAVSSLGMFEQGFYDRVGFGSTSYLNLVSFDPSTLRLDHVGYRQPVRLTVDDSAEMHELHVRRTRTHGGVVLSPPSLFEAELRFIKKPFGLGFRNDGGRLTSFVYGDASDEHGPYLIRHIAYEESADLLLLLRLLKELGDQVFSVKMVEPPETQLQDLLEAPLSRRRITSSSAHENGIRSFAANQLRILDLEACVAARRWNGDPIACNLSLTDPVTEALVKADDATGDAGTADDSDRWTGVGGDYVLTIGSASAIEPGNDPGLPSCNASINAFSRFWFGVRPASSIALTDELTAPSELLGALDRAVALPPPIPAWDF